MDEIESINVWYDNAWPHLEVTWGRGAGYFTATESEEVDVRVDLEGNALGFMVTGIPGLRGRSLSVSLLPVEGKAAPAD